MPYKFLHLLCLCCHYTDYSREMFALCLVLSAFFLLLLVFSLDQRKKSNLIWFAVNNIDVRFICFEVNLNSSLDQRECLSVMVSFITACII